MNEKKFILIFLVVTIVLLFGGVFFIGNTTSTPVISSSQNARVLVVDPASVGFGQVNYNGNNVIKTFNIKNTGTDVLKIYNIKTSCHCTQAFATIDGNDSPNFGMNTLSSWIGEIKPGKAAKITANFDPKYHGLAGVGPITRYISVETNDSSNSKLTFTLTGTVTK